MSSERSVYQQLPLAKVDFRKLEQENKALYRANSEFIGEENQNLGTVQPQFKSFKVSNGRYAERLQYGR